MIRITFRPLPNKEVGRTKDIEGATVAKVGNNTYYLKSKDGNILAVVPIDTVELLELDPRPLPDPAPKE